MRLPALDAAKCTGCGDCVALCPTACLAMAGPLPWLARPLDCVACEICEMLCPAEAIRMAGANLTAASRVEAVETGAEKPKMRRVKKA